MIERRGSGGCVLDPVVRGLVVVVAGVQGLRRLVCVGWLVALWLGVDARPGLAEPKVDALQATPQHVRVARRFAAQFPRLHISRHALDDTMSAMAWTNYLTSLDYERVYFTAEDIQSFESNLHSLDDMVRYGDLSFALQVFQVFKARVQDRAAFVESLFTNGVDVTGTNTYRWKRDDAAWPAAGAERDDLWRRRIQNDYVRVLLAKELGGKSNGVARASTNAVAAAVTNVMAVASTDVVADSAVASTNAEVGAQSQESAKTNGVSAKSTGDSEAESDDAWASALTPEKTVSKRYSQFAGMIADNDAEWVVERFLNAFAHAYDPHSDYMSPSAVQNFDIEMKLSLEGIGALLRSDEGAARVIRLIPGGPADRDKREIRLRPGDRIVGVGQGDSSVQDVLHWPLQKVVERIRGKKGTKVVLSVIPASDTTGTTSKQVDLIRDEVKLEEQAAKGHVKEFKAADGVVHKIGVILLPAFYANVNAKNESSPQFKSSAYDVAVILKDMVAKGVEGVVLDLRTNGGGYLPEAVKMTGLFIESGPTVQVDDQGSIKVLDDQDDELVYGGPLVVLVTRLSASASEILAGALQDYGRAVIVGDSKTHGKGTVQAVVEMSRENNMGSLKVTSSKYYRISGGSTQLKGVAADVVLASPFDRREYGEENLPNVIPWSEVTRASYRRVGDLGEAIPVLRRKSEERRSADARFAAHQALLERIAKARDLLDVPLNLDARRKMAQEERELADASSRLMEEADGSVLDDKESKNDLVLEESMQILCDLRGLDVGRVEKSAAVPDANKAGEDYRAQMKGLRQAVEEWIKGLNQPE